MDLRGYASSDSASRLLKARKIEALLGGELAGSRLLDLGAGSGFLGAYFASRGALVSAADRDATTFAADLPFHRIEGERLPFADRSFDVVVFNHVLEHVGEPPAQASMLAEVNRVLAGDGRLYLAVPNKWALVEPHFRLPLLGAWPRTLADAAVRRWRGHARYDCYPPSHGRLLAMMRAAFDRVEDRSVEAARWAIEHELDGAARVLGRCVPGLVLRMLHGAFPTFIVTALKKP